MSAAAATAFLDKLESDEEFRDKLQSINSDPAAVYTAVTEAGFDVKPEEIQSVFLERYGSELSPEQLDVVAGGIGSNDIWNVSFADPTTWMITSGAVLGGVVLAVAAAAAIG